MKKFRKGGNPKNISTNSDLFTQFHYHGDFKTIWETQKELISSASLQDAELIFASGAILGKNLSSFTHRFPQPLDFEKFRQILRQQALDERKSELTGVFNQPRYIEKILLAAWIGIKHEKTIFIELGTYLGHSVRKISNLFEKVYTVEASENIFLAAQKLFEITDTSIDANLGSSISLLNRIPSEEGNRSIIFLDAHYSTGITSNTYGACPLFQELETIFTRFPKSVCVIDDMRTMTGSEGYPSFREIIDFLPSNMEVVLIHDQMILNLSPNDNFSLLGGLNSKILWLNR
jgi:hypothetical protein